MVAKLRVLETRDQALLRLARLARKRGIRVLTYPLTGETFALSLSHPDVVHRVTPLGCDCLGFTYHNRCTHYAALLELRGELPPDFPDQPAVGSRVAGPVVLCDQCDEVMTHVNGVSFMCACGAMYELDWQSADEVDRALDDLSRRDPDRFAAMLGMLGDEDSMTIMSAPGACRSDAPATLGMFGANPNDIAAVLIWRTDLESLDEAETAA